MKSNETIDQTAIVYYRIEISLSGLAAIGNTHSVPVKGVLVSTDSRLLFYGELTKTPVLVQIDYTDIERIKEKKIQFALFKTIPGIVVYHHQEETFTTEGDLEEFSNLKSFFESVKTKLTSLNS